jgi:Tfp pilus assembly protein PilP
MIINYFLSGCLLGFLTSANGSTMAEHRSPFELKSQAVKSHSQSLIDFPLSSLQFVGTIQDGNRRWALIRQPNNYLAHVGIGALLGKGRLRLVGIQKESLQLEESNGDLGKRIIRLSLNGVNQGL